MRWLVPGSVAAVLALGVLAPGASADLPAKTPEEVLVMAGESDVPAFSGTVLAVTDLGIPTALLGGMSGDPSMGGGLGAEERTVRVWRDGDSLARASVASTMGEKTLIRNADTLWYYDSDTATVVTGAVPDEPAQAELGATPPWANGDVPEPGEAAAWLLDALDPTTEVTAGEPTVVAGRAAYEVVLVPTQDGTLIAAAAIAVDAQTGAVLRVQVTPVGATEPAVDIGYTDFDPTAPPADVFALGTPPGSTVEQRDWDEGTSNGSSAPDAALPSGVEVVGEAWTTVLILPAGAWDEAASTQESSSDQVPVLPADLLQPVPGGGVVTTSLLSVMLADDGRVLVGAVTPEVLAAAAE